MLAVFLFAALVGSAVEVPWPYREVLGVDAAGGGAAGSGPYSIIDTIGQECLGAAEAADYSSSAGFWPCLNAPPMVVNDLIELSAGASGKFALAHVLANDIDEDNDDIRLDRLDTVSANGAQVRLEGRWILYVPLPDATLPDSITYWVTDGQDETANIIQIRQRAPGAEPSRNIVGIRLLPNGDVQLDCVGIPFLPYRTEATTNITGGVWQSLGVATADQFGRFHFIDPLGAAYPVRYYRALYP